jgi:hypothetical protein
MPSASGLPNKKDVARALLLKGAVFVHLDPRADDVIVPKWLKRQPQLVLQVGLDMAVPIPDLRVDDTGVFGTLSFNRTAFTCSVPWAAVFAVVGDDGRGMVWPGSMPQEIAAEVDREARRSRDAQVGAEAEDGAIAELAGDGSGKSEGQKPRRKPRRPAKTATTAPSAAKKPPLSLARVPRSTPKRPALELIAGEGDRSSERGDGTLKLRERSGRPPYLRVVK